MHGVLPAGTRLQRYEVISVLGQGGFGITYLGRDTQLDRDVAIKEYLPISLALRKDETLVLPRSTELAEEFVWGRNRFLDEARTLARFGETPSIIRVFDFLEANGTAYMVMALVRGETLEQRLKTAGALPPAAVDALLRPLLDGLKGVHATGFLHRDIKPANIMLDAKGTPTLIDFGASRAAMAGRTTEATAIFTPGYAAVEQFTSARQGPWTDIYGLSATLHHAITGKPPPSAFDRTLDDEYVPLLAVRPAGFALGLLLGIDAGLAVRATARPQSIDDWRRILDRSDDGGTITLPRRLARSNAIAREESAKEEGAAPAAAPSSPGEAAPSGKRIALYAGALAGVLLLAGGAYLAFAPKQASVGTVAHSLTADELRQALEERRKADAVAIETKKVDEEAQRKAESEVATQRKAEEEVQAKAAADAASRRAAEEEAQRKAQAEAEAKRQADAALAEVQAERQQAERQQAERQQVEEAAEKKAAEAAEASLRLTPLDRQHVQVALTAQGFDTHGSDGAFGPRTREMIAAWEKARGQTATGFLTGSQEQALLREASAAVARFDEAQRKAAVTAPVAAPITAAPKPAAEAGVPIPSGSQPNARPLSSRAREAVDKAMSGNSGRD